MIIITINNNNRIKNTYKNNDTNYITIMEIIIKNNYDKKINFNKFTN